MPLLPKEPEIFPDDLFESGDPWRVAHVGSRKEKALARQLREDGVGYFLPQIEKKTTRGGRRFVSYVPLFPGYVFFRGSAAARQAALRRNVVSVIDVENQRLLDAELRQIRELQLAGASLVPVDEYVAGDAVRVTEGAFSGYQGTVVRTATGDRLVIAVSLLRKTVSVEFPRAVVKKAGR
jgi:transcription antitermination factor NusG